MESKDGRGALEVASKSSSRGYRMRKRREDVEETRQRIVDAAVELHGSVGPAQTTISAIAELAGVQRSTLYRHFADEVAVFGACSSQWFEDHPWPAASAWEMVADPVERLGVALRELYGYYDVNRAMLGNVVRDMAAMPPFVEELMRAQVSATHEALMAPWPVEADRERLFAAVWLAIDFRAWQSLDEAGLTADAAAELMTSLGPFRA
ncbi:MAG: TetR/AcrR family transcriptional regulator [Dehalococcoidia bacterium]|jgi:AcrR family transcriptional regulator|nr:TetR/AcrR family transcriptional regulator [Dehalococcoidia bacterium]